MPPQGFKWSSCPPFRITVRRFWPCTVIITENAGRFDPDEQRAQRYLQRCAEVGDPECSFELATRLLTGDAQTRNVPRAMELLQVASEAGITKAMVLMQAIAQMGVR